MTRLQAVPQARRARPRLVHLRPAERSRDTFDATAVCRRARGLTFAQFVMLTPFPGTLDFAAWEKKLEGEPPKIDGHPDHAPLADSAGAASEGLHAASGDDRRTRSASARRPSGIGSIQLPEHLGARAVCEVAEIAPGFVLISKLYRQMYANTGIATDSARVSRANQWARADRQALPPSVHRGADARSADAGAKPSERALCHQARVRAGSLTPAEPSTSRDVRYFHEWMGGAPPSLVTPHKPPTTPVKSLPQRRS